MAATAAEIQARIDALETRIAGFAGIKGTTFADQSTSFDYDGAVKELSRLRQALVAAGSSSTTRYAATSKGLR